MNDEELLNQINELIRDEIQEDINDYVESVEETKKSLVLDSSLMMTVKS